MVPKRKRLIIVASYAALFGVVVTLTLTALQDNIVFFYTPEEIATADLQTGQPLRLGGMVKDGSLDIDGLKSKFVVTDGQHDIAVHYGDALPSLFREGQGVVAEGQIVDGVFMANNVLAKHDENYMPADVAEKLKDQGVWQGADAKTGGVQ
ncbi:MAG: cytochrome c maturation protein CcmE [Candidatus Puniceispirillum sp.]|jgi:cytochrome c-type biogenesis protein CcmE|uniref:cytochrome c maturation protein CcmE n=1 Tax=Candidatus Puniceispirillum sp. TaxID=2026719 RepID=UPI001EB79676|nr:cytochrome c maturation protein CcmE [Candidatus Puniceispirillum sp.]MBT6416029.1 cytochrome c maturation protein CcmE [Candidatus Puniceispirillum sp.]